MTMNHEKVNAALGRWNNPELRPLFKGNLIDKDGCCCAQGDILRHECGVSDITLRNLHQSDADRMVAKELGIPVFQSVLLRMVNDSKDGCPQDVLSAPEKIIGKYAQQCIALGRYLDLMTGDQLDDYNSKVRIAIRYVNEKKFDDAFSAVKRTCKYHDSSDLWNAAWAASPNLRLNTAWAMSEIQGQDEMRADGAEFFFLSLFGFATPEDIPM